MHDCPTCGMAHDEPVTEVPEPVVVESGPNENDVKIAEVEAAASVERERIYAEQRDTELAAEVERLRGEVNGMREVLDRLSPAEPDPAPEPVIVDMPAPEPEAEDVPAPAETSAPATPKKRGGYWG